jgi:hypothetical protein
MGGPGGFPGAPRSSEWPLPDQLALLHPLTSTQFPFAHPLPVNQSTLGPLLTAPHLLLSPPPPVPLPPPAAGMMMAPAGMMMAPYPMMQPMQNFVPVAAGAPSAPAPQ